MKEIIYIILFILGFCCAKIDLQQLIQELFAFEKIENKVKPLF